MALSEQFFHILVALADSDRHGYSVMQDVAERTGGTIRLSPGTLYGSMKRMLEQGLIDELTGAKHDDRRRYYRLTAAGRKLVRAEAARMEEMLNQARAYGLAPKRG